MREQGSPKPLVVVEEAPIDSWLDDYRAAGWSIIDGWELPGGVAAGERIICAGLVTDDGSASRAVLAAVWGAGVIVEAAATREVVDRLCDDLTRLGDLSHHIGPPPTTVLSDEERHLLRRLSEGARLGEAGAEIHLSRRTADRRLASARRALGVATTSEAIVAARSRSLL